MVKKGKRQEGLFEDAAKANDTSTKFVSYKQQMEKEKANAAASMAPLSKGNDYLSDSDDENNQKPKKKTKKQIKAEKAFEEDQKLETNSQGELQPAFEGVAKKNTRKKKDKGVNAMEQEENLMEAFEGSGSDDLYLKKGGKSSKKQNDKQDRQGKKKGGKKGKQADSEEEDKQPEEPKQAEPEEEKKEAVVEEIEEDLTYPRSMVYCKICSVPPEYCQYAQKDITMCKEWLQTNSPALFNKLYAQEEVKEVKKVDDKATDQIDSTADNAEEEPKKKKKKGVQFGKVDKDAGKIVVTKQHRGKKVLCQISGMEYYTKDIKALAQKMGKKFSCGSSVAVDDILGEVISVQGDVEDRLLDLLETDKDFIALAIPEEKIDFQDQGNKKGRKRV